MKQKINKTTQPIRSQSDRDALASYFWNHNVRDYAFFQFGIATGRRISDLVRLNVRDVARIDRKGRLSIVERFEIREKKTGKFANIMLHPSARRALSKYLRQRRKKSESLGALLNEPLFKSRKQGRDGQYRIREQQAWRILNNAARACGLTYKIGTYSLRKTFGYILYQSGQSIELIQKFLNHSSPAITLAYIGITQDDMDEAILSMNI